jgi:hypothetical protein
MASEDPEKILLFENLLNKSDEGTALLEQLKSGKGISLRSLRAWMEKQHINTSSNLTNNILGGELEKLINIHEAVNVVINSKPDKPKYINNSLFTVILSFVFIAVLFYGKNIIEAYKKYELKYLPFANPEASLCQFNGKYPENWTYKVTNNPISGEILVFMPLENSQEETQVKLIIICSKPQNLLSLSEYSSEVINRLNRRKNLFAIFSIEVKETTFSTREARQLTYTAKYNNQNWIFREVITLDKGIAYQATYAANATKYHKYEKAATQIIRSFSL